MKVFSPVKAFPSPVKKVAPVEKEQVEEQVKAFPTLASPAEPESPTFPAAVVLPSPLAVDNANPYATPEVHVTPSVAHANTAARSMLGEDGEGPHTGLPGGRSKTEGDEHTLIQIHSHRGSPSRSPAPAKSISNRTYTLEDQLDQRLQAQTRPTASSPPLEEDKELMWRIRAKNEQLSHTVASGTTGEVTQRGDSRSPGSRGSTQKTTQQTLAELKAARAALEAQLSPAAEKAPGQAHVGVGVGLGNGYKLVRDVALADADADVSFPSPKPLVPVGQVPYAAEPELDNILQDSQDQDGNISFSERLAKKMQSEITA